MASMSGIFKGIFVLVAFILVAAAGSIAVSASHVPLPAGFEKVHVAGDIPGTSNTGTGGTLSAPTDFAFTPDGRIFILEKSGSIKVFKGGSLLATPLLDRTSVTVSDNERGLLGIAVDPDFATNGYIYIYYTFNNTASGKLEERVSRFTVTGDTASPASEFVLWHTDEELAVFHQAGTVRFGQDGKLYISLGENAHSGLVPPHGQVLTSYDGKILRINKDGTIPSDNPFFTNDEPGVKKEIFAMGFRNPFRFGFTPDGKVIVGDVGETTWEEVDIVVPGGNYGWPHAEGPDVNPSCSSCSFADPVYYYNHAGSTVIAPTPAGDLPSASVTGGVFYSGGPYPAEYDGIYFLGDYVFGKCDGCSGFIEKLVFDDGSVVSVQPFDDHAGSVVSMSVGPDGNLYALNIAHTGDFKGALWKYEFSTGNHAPVVNASATPSFGYSPLHVQFSSAGTTDSDGDTLTYDWDFGDGTSSISANPDPHEYAADGVYTVTLTVSDGTVSTEKSLTVVVGNTPPEPSINVTIPEDAIHLNKAPYCAVAKCYNAGDTIQFSGTAVDADGDSVSVSDFKWTVLFHHGAHVHPGPTVAQGVGSGSFVIPDIGEKSSETFFEIILTAKDSNGYEKSTSSFIFPNKVSLTFDSTPDGLPFVIDGITYTSPVTIGSVVGFKHTLSVSPSILINGQQYSFAYWQDGDPTCVQCRVTLTQRVLVTPPNFNDYVANFLAKIIPTASEITQSNSVPSSGENVVLSAKWLDDSRLGNAILSINENGTWVDVAQNQPHVNEESVPILIYHRVDSVEYANQPNPFVVSVANFTDQMNYLKQSGYHTITFANLIESMRSGAPLPEKPVVITFDDGYENIYTNAFPILKDRGFVATLFVPTFMLNNDKCDTAAEDHCEVKLSNAEIVEMHGAGFEIASHTRRQLFVTDSNFNATEEISGSMSDIEEIIGEPAKTISYPNCQFNSEFVQAVQDAGYIGARWCDGRIIGLQELKVPYLKIAELGNFYNITSFEVHIDHDIDGFPGTTMQDFINKLTFSGLHEFETFASLKNGTGTFDGYISDLDNDSGKNIDVCFDCINPNATFESTEFAMKVSIPTDGFYNLIFRVRTGDHANPTSAQDRYVYIVNGVEYHGGAGAMTDDNFVNDTASEFVTWGNQKIGNIFLTAGLHDIVVKNVEGLTGNVVSYDYLKIEHNENSPLSLSGTQSLSSFNYKVTQPAGTMVSWKIFANDDEGNVGVTQAMSFIVGGSLNFTSESASTGTDSATVTWTTDSPSTSRVVYDTVSHSDGTLNISDQNYGYAFSTTLDSNLVTSHSVLISGLSAGTTYYYRSISSASPETVGDEKSFATSSPNPPAPPASGGGGGGGGGGSRGTTTTTTPNTSKPNVTQPTVTTPDLGTPTETTPAAEEPSSTETSPATDSITGLVAGLQSGNVWIIGTIAAVIGIAALMFWKRRSVSRRMHIWRYNPDNF